MLRVYGGNFLPLSNERGRLWRVSTFAGAIFVAGTEYLDYAPLSTFIIEDSSTFANNMAELSGGELKNGRRYQGNMVLISSAPHRMKTARGDWVGWAWSCRFVALSGDWGDFSVWPQSIAAQTVFFHDVGGLRPTRVSIGFNIPQLTKRVWACVNV